MPMSSRCPVTEIGSGMSGVLARSRYFTKAANAALVVHLDLLQLVVASVLEDEPDARVEEGELAEAMLEPLEVEIDDLEGLGARQEGHLGPALLGRADDLQRRLGVAVAEAHVMLFAVAPDGEIEELAERVHDRNADAVKAARHLVGIVVRRVLELTARVQLGHDDLGRRNALFRMNARGNPAPIVLD